MPEREQGWLAGAERRELVFTDVTGERNTVPLYQWGSHGPVAALVHGWDGRGAQLGATFLTTRVPAVA